MDLVQETRTFIHFGKGYYPGLLQDVLQKLGSELSYDPGRREWSTSVPFEYTSIATIHDFGSADDEAELPEGLRNLWKFDRYQACQFLLKNAAKLRVPPPPPTVWDHIEDS